MNTRTPGPARPPERSRRPRGRPPVTRTVLFRPRPMGACPFPQTLLPRPHRPRTAPARGARRCAPCQSRSRGSLRHARSSGCETRRGTRTARFHRIMAIVLAGLCAHGGRARGRCAGPHGAGEQPHNRIGSKLAGMRNVCRRNREISERRVVERLRTSPDDRTGRGNAALHRHETKASHRRESKAQHQ